jgi:hypothetical protein
MPTKWCFKRVTRRTSGRPRARNVVLLARPGRMTPGDTGRVDGEATPIRAEVLACLFPRLAVDTI